MRNLILCGLVLSGSVNAEVYQCDGVYQDIPCAKGKGQTVQVVEQYVPDGNHPALVPRIDLDQASQIRAAREEGRVMVGMTPNDVRYVWGAPSYINPSVVAGSTHEQWVYRRDNDSGKYVYFSDGQVTSWDGSRPVDARSIQLEQARHIQTAREERKIAKGMTQVDVRFAWGAPTEINPSSNGETSQEQWMYRRENGSTQYVYFDEDDKVASWY